MGISGFVIPFTPLTQVTARELIFSEIWISVRWQRQITRTQSQVWWEEPYPAMFCMETLLESAVGCCDLLLKVEVTVLSSGARIAERGRSFGCEPGTEGWDNSQPLQTP